MYGAVGSEPMNVLSAKKSTRMTVPLPTPLMAVTAMGMLAGAVNEAPAAGLVSETIGGTGSLTGVGDAVVAAVPWSGRSCPCTRCC